jgi:predicted ATP-binding protein involved in virulence
MKIKQLKTTNFRGVQHLNLDLDERLNVFVGANGAGKSTLLDAVAIMLSWVVNRVKHAGSSGRPIQETDITNGKAVASLEIHCTSSERTLDWKLVKTRKGYPAPEERSNLTGIHDYVKFLQQAIAASKEHTNLPLYAYYPVNRSVLDIPLRIKEKHTFSLLAGYDDSLTSGANFRTFFEWFREREDIENESRKYQQSSLFDQPQGKFPDPQLEAVRRAISCLMPEFTNLSVRRSPLRMEVHKNGQILTVNQLSDGEKCLMAMVGDLARRMAMTNPDRQNPLEGDGVILIDEIDLHLHPKWQRMAVPGLLNVFPNCQFLISTHSPHVMTHVQPENLFLLSQTTNGIVADKPTESYGKNVERILEDLMGLETTRPDTVGEGLRTIFDLIDQNSLVDARKGISTMREKIGNDPELAKAEVLIKRKEILGK